MSHEALVIYQILRAFPEIAFFAIACNALTGTPRIKNRFLSLLLPFVLDYLACINNIAGGPINYAIFTPLVTILAVVAVSKDKLLRKLGILIAVILCGILPAMWQEFIFYLAGFTSSYGMGELPSSDILVEFGRNYCTVAACDCFLLVFMLSRKGRTISLFIPSITVILLLLFETGLIIPVFNPETAGSIDYADSVIPLMILTAATLIILILVMIIRSEKLKERERESIYLQSLTDFDREYYGLVRKQIEETSMLRHDAVNYIDQILGLITSQDEDGKSSAVKLIDELEMKLM